jgi:4-amino-4-deoxy-L-arabinose transferase-like glycosyltransferase
MGGKSLQERIMSESNPMTLIIKQAREFTLKQWLAILFIGIFVATIIFLLFYRLDSWPSVWWDEGWTLSAARNWIEQGHLGNYLDGQPVPPRIPVRFPVVVPVALSMKLLGVGTWQGRLPGVIFTIFSLALVGSLCSKMFDRKTGVATVILILSLSVYVFHPLIIGRQVMAEMPMMFYLLSGYLLVWLALTKSPWWGVGAALLFGVAIHAKLQVPPFWLVSMFLTILISISLRQRRAILILVGLAIGSLIVAGFVLFVQNIFMPGSFEGLPLVLILFNSVIFVPVRSIRISALAQILLFGVPLLLGYIWAGWRILRYISIGHPSKFIQMNPAQANTVILQSGLWGLGASWFVWYSAMSIDWIRYMFPPFFIGSMFVAGYLGELTNGFDLRLLVKRSSALILGREAKFYNLQAMIMLIALSINFGAAIISARIGLTIPRYDPELAAKYLQNNIPAGALVESFESELYFLAPNIKYHFPSDLVSMQAQRKTTIDPSLLIDYDPLKANPDYLVVGPMGHLWPLYNSVIDQGQFQLIADIGDYQIYHINNSK